MTNKRFDLGDRFKVTAFTAEGGSGAFLSLKIGNWNQALVDLHLEPAEARELARLLDDAADFATPRVGTAADLGCKVL